MTNNQDFSGLWHAEYQFTSTARPGAFTSAYDMKIQRVGNQLIVQSIPNKEKSYLLLRLTLDDRIATGTWHEETSPVGFYAGVECYGAIQLVLSEEGTTFNGMWIGYNRRFEVQGGEWTMTRLPDDTDPTAHEQTHPAVE